MKNIFLLLLFISSVSSAQFAIINNASGFANIRKLDSPASEVISKLPNGSIVYCFEEETLLTSIDFSKDGVDLSGYVENGDVKMIPEFESLPYSYSNEHKVILRKDSLSVIITEMDFSKGNSVFTYSKVNPGLLQSINGKEFFGTDGEVPTRKYGFIDVTIGKTRIPLPQEATENLFQPTLENSSAHYDRKNDILYIISSNSDGAGGYEVIWIIEKQQYKTRHIFYGF